MVRVNYRVVKVAVKLEYQAQAMDNSMTLVVSQKILLATSMWLISRTTASKNSTLT